MSQFRGQRGALAEAIKSLHEATVRDALQFEDGSRESEAIGIERVILKMAALFAEDDGAFDRRVWVQAATGKTVLLQQTADVREGRQ